MLHTRFRDNRLAGSGEEDFRRVFTIHLPNVLTDHHNVLAYIKAWLSPNNKIKILLLYYTMT